MPNPAVTAGPTGGWIATNACGPFALSVTLPVTLYSAGKRFLTWVATVLAFERRTRFSTSVPPLGSPFSFVVFGSL